MHIRLLGPVGIAGGGELRTVAGERRTTVLAVLALAHGEVVSTDRLIDAVWGADPPATAQNTLQQHVSYLRRALGDAGTIAARPPGYVLTVAGGGDPTDAARADRLIRATADTDDPRERVRLLREAVALWHGRPLAGAAGLDDDAERLHTVWLRAQVALAEDRLLLGEHAAVVAGLGRLAADHPVDERLHGLLMLAQYRSGRPDAALGTARRLRETLGADLGLDPGPRVRDLEAAIRRRDPALDVDSAPAAAPGPVPAQLPLAVRGLRGRAGELAALGELAAAPGPVVAAITGPPGVGKTSLAVHWAQAAAGRYPDGQLYVDLRGFDPRGAATDPAEALRGFLGALNGPEALPDEPDELAARFRVSVAGRRVLVVLDNARDAEQVRPLLPESGRSMTLITSRTSLTPPGARPLALDLLGPAEARDLLAGRLGPDRVAAEPDAADEIIARCARLPLALAVAAAQVATRPGVSLAEQAAQLRDAAGRLDALDGGDPATDVQAVFSWSYRALSPAAARLFRLLGLHPGPDLTAPGAASLAGEPLTRTQSRLRALLHANLLAEPVPGRYALHDLLKAYAIRRSHTEDTGEDRRAAVHRVLDHHLHTAHAAALLIDPGRRPLDPPASVAGLTVPRLGDPVRALAWFEANYRVLTAAVRLAADEGFDVHAWQLPWTMTTYLDWRGHRPELIAAQTAALAVMQRIGEVPGRAGAHREIGRTLHRLGRAAEAAEHLAESVRLYATLGDGIGEARARYSAGMLASAAGRPDAARAEFGATLALAEAAGDLLWQGRTLTALSWAWVHSGDLDRALRLGDRAQALLQRAGDRHGEAFAWSTNAGIHHRRGDYEAATRAHRQAIRLMHDFGDRASHAGMLAELGDTRLAAGDPPGAADAWRRALHLYEQLGDPAADEIRRRLAAPPV
ncbi:AfsR/SARP family transcriptional regulator [Dactylosporangium matsuzakiense]|uniref:SARP family transcriptional regulator n=1 Tax=Dactylosporangium matsuzakiense TaxID=53360 RepID=A0A9W6KR46_9ACTN|nr:BTAD domain-containing putative transcriptional regulator [Dactylosporangium matsuzakiense]GLL05707.1 SARP family transcriptional regulator [Dactylosporangium matsuzakiense]